MNPGTHVPLSRQDFVTLIAETKDIGHLPPQVPQQPYLRPESIQTRQLIAG